MVRIRLKRMGRKNRAFFRICAMDGRTRRDGKDIETLGYYDPHVAEESKKYKVNKERAAYWLSVGAQPSQTCKQILLKHGVEIPGCVTRERLLSEDEVADRKKAREEKQRAREEAKSRKALSQPVKLSKKDLRSAKRAGG